MGDIQNFIYDIQKNIEFSNSNSLETIRKSSVLDANIRSNTLEVPVASVTSSSNSGHSLLLL